MKRRLKILICLGLLFALIAVPVTAGAASGEPYGNEGFYVKGYDVQTVIGEDNVYDVTETIKIYYTEPKHGIYRDIPINREETREGTDGRYYTNKVSSSVWDVSVKGYGFSTEDSYDTFNIRIGSPDYLVTGDQTYVIHYKIGFGDDGSKDWDEAYYNIIGTDWPCSIDNVTFSVTLPKEFDKDKLGFSLGYSGDSGFNPDILKYSVEGNTISGNLTQRLDEYAGLTMRLELPQGYFKVPDVRLPDWIIMGIMGALALLSIILFLLFGLDRKPVQTVEFYAPDGLTPSEVGYIIDGSVDDRDVVSLIVYWADKGYLSIADNGNGDYTLTKLKEIEKGAKGFERQMFEGLFRKGDIVTTDSLKYTFNSTYNSTKTMIQMSFESDERRIFTKRSLKLMPLLTFFTTIPFVLSIIMALSRIPETGWIFAIVMGLMIGVSLLFPSFMLIGFLRRWRGESKRGGKLIGRLIFWGLLTAAAVGITAAGAYEALLPWTALAATVIIGLCAVFIRKWTPKGVEWLGKISGLKHFIEVAEKDRINLLVQQNPSYFYNILPYAYVLGVTDKWVKNFESITVAPPTWYYGHGMFTPMLFMGSMNGAMNTMRTQMTAVRPSSGGSGGFGGGGFSGGGFSGGGGGGGGGHSW